MFSQYNLEQQAWARQQALRRQAPRTNPVRQAGSAAAGGTAPLRLRLGYALAAAAPTITMVLFFASR
jgi:hypothetical protein